MYMFLLVVILDPFVSGRTPPACFWVLFIYIMSSSGYCSVVTDHPQAPEREAASFCVCVVDVHMYPSSCTRAVNKKLDYPSQ